MGQVCTICQHVQADEISAAIGRGETGRAIAREFGVSEAALRRHLANHHPWGSDEAAPGAPELPVDAPEDLDPAAVARRAYEIEEEQRRDARLRELTAEEEQRRDRERAASEREAAIAWLREQAADMAERRGELEDRAEAELVPLLRTLEELEDLHKRHTAVMSRAGTLSAFTQPVDRFLQDWLQVKLGRYSPGGFTPAALDPYKGAGLRERDRLAAPAGAPTDAA